MSNKRKRGPGTLESLNRMLAEIFSAPKAKIDEAEASRMRRASPKPKAGK